VLDLENSLEFERGRINSLLYNGFMPSIPASARPFFQEFNFEQIDPERHSDLVIERLLAFGNRDEESWLLRNYGLVRVQRWLSEIGINRLPPRRYRLWCVLLDVPESVQEPAPLWPY
jgi:hypothetical protein